jgi:cation diffusion facilitator CzcD-associated flavoprotein CzcO
MSAQNTIREVETLVMGAGMSGLAMAIQLLQAGRRSFVVVEKSAGLGGTWWDNRYPGAHVDVPSPLYCFSFAPYRRWTRRFAAAPEILAYMQHIAQEHGLAPYLMLGRQVMSAAWDPSAGRWTITLDGGEVLLAQFFVCSTGPLSVPKWPDIEGREAFRGTQLHTARWDPTVPLQGQRIGVIGTGSTASQLVPPLAQQAQQLHVFQRTPNWVLPRLDRLYNGLDRWAAGVGFINQLTRWWWAGVSEWFRRGFEEGTLARRNVLALARVHMNRQVADPTLRQRLTPTYPFGCKRIIFSSDYLSSFNRANVELVTTGIRRITPDGVELVDGTRRTLDVLVCATGFDVQHSMAVPVTGRGGQTLQQAWAAGPEAYFGSTVAGFPNFFLMLGPNTATGHTSTLLFVEPQAQWVLRAIDSVQQRGQRWLDVRPGVMQRFNDEVAERLKDAVWAHCRSWYRADNGRNVAIWPGYTLEYRRRIAAQALSDFEFG